jgi:hypothetical protein
VAALVASGGWGCGDSGSSATGGSDSGGAGGAGGGGAGGEEPAGPTLALAAIPTATVERASMNVARAGHTATLLADGRVLVIGGETLSTRAMLDSVELYDPVADSWAELSSLPAPRNNHTATLLPDGLVLVVGGGTSNAIGIPSGLEVQSEALLYDPATGASESLGPNLVARHGHVALPLPSGKVLIAAGAGDESTIEPSQGAGNPQPFGNALASAELFDPETRTFEATGALAQARYAFAASTLADGRVLIAGGASYEAEGPVSHATAELYDETAGTFSSAGSFDGSDRLFPGASRLEDGRVLVFGGKKSNVAFLDDAQIYDPATNGWTQFPDVPPARTLPIVVPAVGGGAILLGGFSCTDSCGSPKNVDLWSPDAGVVTGLETSRGRTLATTTVLFDGSVLVIGGYTLNSQRQVELLYDAGP